MRSLLRERRVPHKRASPPPWSSKYCLRCSQRPKFLELIPNIIYDSTIFDVRLSSHRIENTGEIEYMPQTHILWIFALDDFAARFLAIRNVLLENKRMTFLFIGT